MCKCEYCLIVDENSTTAEVLRAYIWIDLATFLLGYWASTTRSACHMLLLIFMFINLFCMYLVGDAPEHCSTTLDIITRGLCSSRVHQLYSKFACLMCELFCCSKSFLIIWLKIAILKRVGLFQFIVANVACFYLLRTRWDEDKTYNAMLWIASSMVGLF